MRTRHLLAACLALAPAYAHAHAMPPGPTQQPSTLEQQIDQIFVDACLEESAEKLVAYEQDRRSKNLPMVYMISTSEGIAFGSRAQFAESKFSNCLRNEWITVFLQHSAPSD